MSKATIEQAEGLNFTETIAKVPFGHGKTLELRTGKLAKQANGAVLAKVGGTVVLAAVVMSDKPSDRDFFPLMVDYREKFYASGRIPGGFFKREARPSDNESLRARLTDRTLRPLFPKGFRHEIIVSITVLGMDLENPAELVSMCAASAALHISDIPFKKPVAGVRVGRVDGDIIVNPSFDEMLASDMDLVVAGHKDALNMVEAGANEASEDDIVAGLEAAHAAIKDIVASIDQMRKKCGKPKFEYAEPEVDADLLKKVKKLAAPHLKEIAATFEKKARDLRGKQAVAEILEALGEEYEERADEVKSIFHDLDEEQMRANVLKKGTRADGRKPSEIRPIWSEIDVLPSVHGSSVFTRGQTQAMAVVTLGTVDDMQMIDDMTGVRHEPFFLHYNFPGFSVGEAKPPRGPGRREIGHGKLAERAISKVLPQRSEFPYTIRAVIEILESNGSSSMATVCSTSMALMDAGVPIKRPVAGIAMGLIADEKGKDVAILSDIQGIEDHCGDMDFKVCGTSEGITSLQMDIKIDGVTSGMMAKALEQARAGRLHILDKMAECIDAPKTELKPHTPRMTVIKIPVDNIRDVIGSGGKVIRGMQEKTGAKIDIEDDGTIYISTADRAAMDATIQMIDDIVRDIEEGEVYTGVVTRTLESGAIVQLTANKDGMIHISALDHHHVDNVEDVVKVGDTVEVKVIEVDKARGRIRLSRKALLERPDGMPAEEDRPRGPRFGDRDRGPRRDDRGGRGGDRDRGPRRDGGDRGPRRDSGERSSEPAGDGGGERRSRRPRPPRGDFDS